MLSAAKVVLLLLPRRQLAPRPNESDFNRPEERGDASEVLVLFRSMEARQPSHAAAAALQQMTMALRRCLLLVQAYTRSLRRIPIARLYNNRRVRHECTPCPHIAYRGLIRFVLY